MPLEVRGTWTVQLHKRVTVWSSVSHPADEKPLKRPSSVSDQYLIRVAVGHQGTQGKDIDDYVDDYNDEHCEAPVGIERFTIDFWPQAGSYGRGVVGTGIRSFEEVPGDVDEVAEAEDGAAEVFESSADSPMFVEPVSLVRNPRRHRLGSTDELRTSPPCSECLRWRRHRRRQGQVTSGWSRGGR